MSCLLQLDSVGYSYKLFTLGPVNMKLETGVVTALVGPNGSGKSTLINRIMGFLNSPEGLISISGKEVSKDAGQWKQKTGYAGENSKFFERWSVSRNLKLISDLYPSWSDQYMNTLIDRFKLDAAQKVRALSRGNRMKLALIAALSYRPHLLLFDEPADGLDPEIRAEMLNVLKEMMENDDCSIIMATHHLDEFSPLVDELIFLKNGQVEMQQDLERVNDRWRLISFQGPEKSINLDSVVNYRQEGKDHRLISYNLEKTEKSLQEAGIKDFHKTRMDLDDILKWMVKGDKNVVTG